MLNGCKVVVIAIQNANWKLGEKKDMCMSHISFRAGRVDHGDDYFLQIRKQGLEQC